MPETPISLDAKLKIGFVPAPRFTLTSFAGFIDAIRLAIGRDG